MSIKSFILVIFSPVKSFLVFILPPVFAAVATIRCSRIPVIVVPSALHCLRVDRRAPTLGTYSAYVSIRGVIHYHQLYLPSYPRLIQYLLRPHAFSPLEQLSKQIILIMLTLVFVEKINLFIVFKRNYS